MKSSGPDLWQAQAGRLSVLKDRGGRIGNGRDKAHAHAAHVHVRHTDGEVCLQRAPSLSGRRSVQDLIDWVNYKPFAVSCQQQSVAGGLFPFVLKMCISNERMANMPFTGTPKV